jgi:hypothetical protein
MIFAWYIDEVGGRFKICPLSSSSLLKLGTAIKKIWILTLLSFDTYQTIFQYEAV